MAQNAPSQQAIPPLQEVVVTAQKREQRVQDVPVAVQVLQGDTLDAQGVHQFTDLTKAAPSLVISQSENPVNASVAVRGIGTFAFSPGVERSVAVQIDDVPVAFLARAFSDLDDIERIEVLRGPQSTLYGRSASAGLISIVTKAPTRTLTGRIGGFATQDDEYGISGALAGPVTDTLGFRVTANYDDYDGNVRNIALDKDVNGRKNKSIRGKLQWEPRDGVDVTGQLSYLDGDTTIGRPYIALGPDARLRGNPTLPASVFAPGVTASPDNRDVVNNITSGTNYRDVAESLRVSIDLGGPTLMSITAYDKYTEFDILDQDESAVAALDNRQLGTFDSHQLSQEVRLVSPGTARFRYTLGLFYSDFEYSRDFARGPFFSQAGWYATNGQKQAAAFSQLEFDVASATTLIGGLRFGKEKIDVTFLDSQNGSAYFAGDSDDSYTTYKAGVQRKFSPDLMAFLTFATGHKGQAYDISTGFNANRLDPVDEETSDDWQLGVKSEFLDRTVTLDATLFNTEFKNFQAQGIETLPDGTFNFRLANVGKLRVRGVEIEGELRPNRTFSLTGGVTYLDAKILEFPFAQCYAGQTSAQGCTGSPARQNLAGFRPAQAPQWKAALTGDYTANLSAQLDGVVQVGLSYQSRMNYTLSQDPQTAIDAYTIVNLSAGVRDSAGHWQVLGYVNNLFNEHYFSNLTNSFGNFGNNLATQSYLPRDFKRYYGLRASYDF